MLRAVLSRHPFTKDAYTVADAYVFVDLPKYFFPAVDQTRVTFRVRTLFDRRYAIWAIRFIPTRSCSARCAPMNWPRRSNGRLHVVDG